MKLGLATGTIIIFSLWALVGSLLFDWLLNTHGKIGPLEAGWTVILFIAIGIYERMVRSSRMLGSLEPLGRKVTPVEALVSIAAILLLTCLVIGAQLFLPEKLLYRILIFSVGGLLLLVVVHFLEVHSLKREAMTPQSFLKRLRQR